MKLSTRGQYGLKAMFVLAEEYGTQEPVSLSEIAKRQHIPENYLEQLARELRKAGLINSIRGLKDRKDTELTKDSLSKESFIQSTGVYQCRRNFANRGGRFGAYGLCRS